MNRIQFQGQTCFAAPGGFFFFNFKHTRNRAKNVESCPGTGRWPDGFRCPRCEGKELRGSFIGSATSAISPELRHQATLNGQGTILEATKFTSDHWFLCLSTSVGQAKTGISSLSSEASSRCETTERAWLLQNKDHAGN